jgi:type I site-specific restriction endonuclease
MLATSTQARATSVRAGRINAVVPVMTAYSATPTTHENDPPIHKLRFNERLTKDDLDSLEKMLIDVGAGTHWSH